MANSSGPFRRPARAGPSGRQQRTRQLGTLVVLSAVLALARRPAGALGSPGLSPAANKLTISSSGINVPKRAALIAGLDQQFRARQNASTSPLAGILPAPVAAPAGANKVGGLLAAVRFGPRARPGPPANVSTSAGGLYLDRHQQELLAAHPDPNLAARDLLRRSDGPSAALSAEHQRSSAPVVGGEPPSGGALVQRLLAQAAQPPAGLNQANELAGAFSGPSQGLASARGAASQSQSHQQQQQQQQQQAQQSYRGYSLIELEVKSEPDRRYVQDLYGNLSAALNEQAQRPQSFNVSPYVDIDFWSFKTALNDQIDIMVSPKSRAFILAQLGRARIKHRVKIDDIQARLDQQSISATGGQQAAQPLQANQAPAPASNANYNHELSGRQWAAAPAPYRPRGQQAEPDERQQAELDGRQRQQQQQQQLVSWSGLANDSLFFENYQRLADMNQYLESLVGRARDIARVQVIGRSSQGRYLRVLRLGYEQREPDPLASPTSGEHQPAALGGAELAAGEPAAERQQRPVALNASSILEQFLRRQRAVKKVGSLWLDGGTHAREWISPATVLFIAFRLADNHAKCLRFFDYLHMVVGQQQQQQQLAGRAAAPAPVQLDGDLLDGINEINTSLLASQKARPRARSELEQKLELLAKRPQEVASEHACDLELEQLLRKYTFYVMPVLNPDGYEYSHTHNRLWRKTRSTSNHPIYRHFCLGADPNRNYDARHGATGSSSHPCSQTYGGSTPFTEPETRHQSNFVYAHRDSLKMFISFHSYSQMILLPFSHSKQLAPDHKDLESVGQAAVRAIERTHGTQYKVGPSASILYTASGTASDWAYEKAGIKYSYTIELRDTGNYGFLLPRQQIIPTGEETFNGLLAMIQQMELNDNLLTSKSDGLAPGKPGGPSGQTAAAAAGPDGLVHAPDLDQLRPFGRFRPRPAQLENAIDGSDTWATPEPRPPGVREHSAPPLNPNPNPPANNYNDEQYEPANRILEDEVLASADEEPDAGLAFEGEGELMEPTNNLSVSSALNGQSSDAAAHSAAELIGHIYAHSSDVADVGQRRRLLGDLQARRAGQMGGAASQDIRQRIRSNQHQLGLSANGRSLINSPPAPARSGPDKPRRESSNGL